MGNEVEQNNRVAWIDIAKFLGIVAIVYAHAITEGIVNKYLYSFHVPLFFSCKVQFSV